MDTLDIGHKVKVSGLTGTITNVGATPKGVQYKVDFDRKDVVGSGEWYDASVVHPIGHTTHSINGTKFHVFKVHGDTQDNIDECCPICKTKWNISRSPIFNTEWIDCVVCHKTKETILKEIE